MLLAFFKIILIVAGLTRTKKLKITAGLIKQESRYLIGISSSSSFHGHFGIKPHHIHIMHDGGTGHNGFG